MKPLSETQKYMLRLAVVRHGGRLLPSGLPRGIEERAIQGLRNRGYVMIGIPRLNAAGRAAAQRLRR